MKKHINAYDSEAEYWISQPMYKVVLLAVLMLLFLGAVWVKERFER